MSPAIILESMCMAEKMAVLCIIYTQLMHRAAVFPAIHALEQSSRF